MVIEIQRAQNVQDIPPLPWQPTCSSTPMTSVDRGNHANCLAPPPPPPPSLFGLDDPVPVQQQWQTMDYYHSNQLPNSNQFKQWPQNIGNQGNQQPSCNCGRDTKPLYISNDGPFGYQQNQPPYGAPQGYQSPYVPPVYHEHHRYAGVLMGSPETNKKRNFVTGAQIGGNVEVWVDDPWTLARVSGTLPRGTKKVSFKVCYLLYKFILLSIC